MLIQEFYSIYWKRIEKCWFGVLKSGNINPSAREVALYHLKNHGKRIRPYLCTDLFLGFSPDISQCAIDFAASMELFHNASLIHDDLEDRDFFRRGELNVWKKFSPEQAINIGDLLFSKSLEIILESELEDTVKFSLISRTITAINDLINGQMLEISFRDTADMKWDDWEQIASQKTGALLRLIFEGVFLISGINISEISSELMSIGRLMGIIYQMRDDLLDVMGLKEGRSRGSDILEGKMTCLSIKAMETERENDVIIKSLLLEDKSRKGESRVEELLKFYEEEGIIEELLNYYSSLIESCRKHPLTVKFPETAGAIGDFLDLLVFENTGVYNES